MTALLMQRQQHKTKRNMKSQGNKRSWMECNNFQKLIPKDKEICDLPVKQFKIYYSCFKEVQRTTRGTIQQKTGKNCEQNKKFNGRNYKKEPNKL